MKESFPDRVYRIQREQNVSREAALRVAHAERRIEQAKEPKP